MNMAIIGPGSIGLLLAGYLHKTNAPITLVDCIPERADYLNKHGIRWEGSDSDFNFKVPVTLGLQNPDNFDLVIIAVKAYHTENATNDLARAGYRGAVMTLQNGVGNIEMISRNLPASPIIAGITSEGANLASINHMRHAGKGNTAFGKVEPNRPSDEFLDEVASIMRSAGMNIELSNDAQSLVWSKVVMNAGINALTAILQVQNGRLLDIKPARELVALIVHEGCEIIRRKGLKQMCNDPVAHVLEVCRLTALNYSSMYQDLAQGNSTEIDYINGAIAREGLTLGIKCPYNEMLTKIIHSIEQLKKEGGC